MWPNLKSDPWSWRRLVCYVLAGATLGRWGHRWITISYDPKRRLCTRCQLVG